MNNKKQRYILLPVMALAISSSGLYGTSAISEQGQQARDTAQSRQQDVRSANNERQLEAQERVSAKLEENRLRTCQKREASIKRIMTNMQTRGERQLEVFRTISERTQAFYGDRQLNVAEYDEAVLVVNEKELAATTIVNQTSTSIEDFSCTSDDPIAMKDMFKAQLQDQIEALKAYKTAVKDLIVTVKSGLPADEEATTEQTDEETADNSQTGEQQ